jgi:glutaredoxin
VRPAATTEQPDADGVSYDYVEVDKDEAAAARAIEISGAKSIPVIVFPDGTYLIEPSNADLLTAVGVAGLLPQGAEETHDLGGGD